MRLNKIAFITILIFVMIIILYHFSGEVLVYAASKAYGIDISYKTIRNDFFKKFTLSDLKLVGKKMPAINISSKNAILMPAIPIGSKKGAVLRFELRDVNFFPNDTVPFEKYDTIDQLISAPFKGRWTYGSITGSIRKIKNGVRIENFEAKGDKIKLAFKGDIYSDNTIDSEIIIYFSTELTKRIPAAVSTAALEDAPDGWKSLSVNLTGNYASPSIQISSKLFRLNFKSVTQIKS